MFRRLFRRDKPSIRFELECLNSRCDGFGDAIRALIDEIEIERCISIGRRDHHILYKSYLHDYLGDSKKIQKEGYYIFKTFDNGKRELWLKREESENSQ